MSKRMPTGIGTMEARAAYDLAPTMYAREQERIANAIELRATSNEVALLNDLAQLFVYGSGNHTFIHPETGEVIASPERPFAGKLEEISTDSKYGKGQNDRDASAREYQEDIDALLGDGLQLCQAKMVMDMREADAEARINRTADLMKKGMLAAEADAKAREIYEKKDATRLRLIKEGGAFTSEEYEKVRKGEQLYPAVVAEPMPDAKGVDDEGDKTDKEPPKNPELEPELLEALKRTRKALVSLSIDMRRRTIPSADLREKYEAAYSAYDSAYKEAGARAVELLRGAGLEEGDIRALVVQGVISEKLAFDREQQEHVSNTSDKYWNRKLGKFTAYWARSGVAKRMILGGAVTAGMTIVTAGALTTAGVGGLMAGAAALSTRVASSLARSKVDKDAALINGYERKTKEDFDALRTRIYQVALNSEDAQLADAATLLMSESVDARVDRDLRENRKRLVTSLIGVAAGAGAGLVVDNVVNSPFERGGGKAGATTTTTPTAPGGTTTTTVPSGGGGPPTTTPRGTGGGSVLGGGGAAGEVLVHIDPGEGTSHIARDTLGINFATRGQWDAFNAITNPLFKGLPGTYFDSSSGEWRIQNPGSFKVPRPVLEAMQRAAEQVKAQR